MKVNLRAGQWVGILVVLAICFSFGTLLPNYAESTTPSNTQVKQVSAGTRVSEGQLSIVAAKGWSHSTEVEGILFLKKGQANFFFNSPVKATQESMADRVTKTSRGYASDKTLHYEVGDPVPFTAESGLKGSSILLVSPQDTIVLCAVTDGQRLVEGTLTVDAAGWKSVHPDVDPMLESLAIGAAKAQERS